LSARWKAALSVFIVFHLFCVMLAPNSMTYLGTRAQSVVGPYLTFLELASTWGFFAPDPGPPPVYIEYEAIGEDGVVVKTGTWPDKAPTFFLRERHNRRIAVARFLMSDPRRIEKMLGPYYCGRIPEARSVRFWRVIEGMPNLHDVAKGTRKIGDGVGTERKYEKQVLCEGRT
jgi:hypothetical protein